jgi:hypothetical protein
MAGSLIVNLLIFLLKEEGAISDPERSISPNTNGNKYIRSKFILSLFLKKMPIPKVKSKIL